MPKRDRYTLPDFIRAALKASTKLETTRRKRLDEMLDELEHGGVHIKMKWNGSQVGLLARLSLYMAK